MGPAGAVAFSVILLDRTKVPAKDYFCSHHALWWSSSQSSQVGGSTQEARWGERVWQALGGLEPMGEGLLFLLGAAGA